MRPDLYAPGSAFHQARRRYRDASIRCLDEAITQLGRPHALFDVGCGEGALVQWCQQQSIDAWGVDLAIPDDAPDGLLAGDLRQPLDVHRVFDLVLCWEVAEHLPLECAETLCDTLARHLARPGGRLLFTAARPGQKGIGHINCQPPAVWREWLQARGLVWLERESAQLATRWRKAAPETPWYAANIQVLTWA